MKTSHTRSSRHGCPLWHVQTVVVRLSRKITMTYRLRAQRRLSQLMAIMLTSISPLALALPTGAELVAGQADISTPTANSMVVNQATDKAILNWQTFNIGAGQSVQFVQPGASSVALNRVVGNQASSIYGSLSANGQVFLINPAGVMFAPGAQVNVGGLVASSLGISNENFLAGKYTFSGDAGGAVENYGSIFANNAYVVLAAPIVTNAGSIVANGGSIGLLAGSRVTVDNSGAGLVKFSVDAAAAQAAIVNSGAITADGGQVAVLASAMGDAMATVINQTGVIRANSAVERNGVIVLSGGNSGVVKVAGTIQATGTNDGSSGGTIKILGDKVALLDGARLDVSGKAGGGTALVGGDYQGKGTEQNAGKTLVSSGAVIDASATHTGDGGKVIVWADDTTRFYGAIKAKGGPIAGDGGFVEVSGKQALDLRGKIDVAAPTGVGGKVLLDPQDIVLNATAQTPPPNNANGTPDLAFNDAPNPAIYTIQVADVTGYSELFLQASRDISLESSLTMSAGNSVRLEAGNNITTKLGAKLAVTGAGSITLKADNDITTNATLSATGTGSINLKADADNSGIGTLALGAAVTSQTGGITLSGARVTSTAAASIATTGAANSAAGQLTITSSGIVNLGGAITATGGTASAGLSGLAGGTVNINAVGGITTAGINASGSNGGAGNTAGGNAGSITVANTGSGNIATAALTASTGNALGTGAGGTAGSIVVSNTALAGSAATGVITTTGGTKGHGGNIALSASGALASGNIISSGGATISGNAGRNAGTVNIVGAGINLGASSITANGSAGLGSSQTGGVGGEITLTSTAGITQTGAIAASGGAGSATNGAGGKSGSISVSNTVAGNVSLGALTARTGAALGTGTGGQAGTIAVSNAAAGASLATGNISSAGGVGGDGGNITLASQGDVSVTGTLNASATALAAGTRAGRNAGNITITGVNRSVSGTVTASGSAANGTSQAGGNAGTVSITGSGSLNTAAVTAQSGAATTGGAGGNAGSITLSGSTVTNTGALNTSGGTNGAGGAVNITAQGALSLNSIAAASGTGSTVRGDVSLLAGGPITQTGSIVARNLNATTANAAGSAITLSNLANDAQNINLQVRDGTAAAIGAGNAAAAINYRDSNAVVVSGINNGTGTAGNVTLSAGGAITQTGAITASNLSAKTLVDAGAAITLTNAANEVNTVDLQARNGAGTANAGGAISYTDVSALNVAAAQSTTTVTLIAGDTLTQSGAIAANTLTATTRNNAGAAITLDNSANNVTTANLQVRDLAGTANAAAAIVYTDANAIAISGINNGTGTGGDVTLNAGASITQSGAINTRMLAASLTGAASSLVLGNAGNNIAQLSNITTPGGFTLVNGNNAVTIGGAINTSNTGVSISSGTAATTFTAGASIASAGGNVVLTNTNVSKVLGKIDTTGGAAAGNFNIAGVGAVSQQAGSALKIKGTTAIAAGAGNSITLTEAGNDFGGAVAIGSALNVAISDNSALALGTSIISGTLGVNAAGPVTQTGALTVNGATTIAAGSANDITLNNAANNFSSIAITSGRNVSIRDSNALVLAGANVANAMTVLAGGAITQSAAITATSLSAKTLINAGAAVRLDNVGNDVATVDLRARNAADTANANGTISYRDASDFNIAGIATTGALTLQSSGNITQTGGVTAASLAVNGTGSGALNLGTLSNTIATLNPINAAGGFALNNGNAGVIVAGNINTINNAVSISTGTGTYTQNTNIDIIAGSGPITVSADTININANAGSNALATSGVLTLKANSTGRAMSLGGTSAFDLSTAEMNALASGASGSIVFGDTASTGVMTIGSAVSLAGKTLTLNAGLITDTGVKTITASKLTLNANGQIGSNNANGIDIAVADLSVNTTGNADAFIRSGAIKLGAGSSGSNLGSGTLDILAAGTVTQTAGTGNIRAGTLKLKTLSAGIANIALNNSGNDVAVINLQSRNLTDSGSAAGAIEYRGSGGFDVAAVTTGGTAALSAAAAVTQSGAIVAAGLALDGAGGNYTLRHADNAVTTLAATTSSLDYSQTTGLTVGTVGTINGIATTGTTKIETTGASANLTLTKAVSSGASGDSIVLKAGSSNAAGVAAGGQFINTLGAGGLNAAVGRYLVYSGDPGTTTEGVSGYNKQYNSAASHTPSGSANMFMYRIAPVLTVTANNATRVYGQANPVFSGTAVGFIDGDTAASVGVSRSSAAVFNTPVAAGSSSITSAATNNENYTLVLNNGQMSISKASISKVTGITAADKMFDGNVNATLNTGNAGFNGIVAGDVLTVATASGNFDTLAVGREKSVQITGITLAGASAANYTLASDTVNTTASITASVKSPSDLFKTPDLSMSAPRLAAVARVMLVGMETAMEKKPAVSLDSDKECVRGNATPGQSGSNINSGCAN